ncbi:MAG: UDP-N-acetylmuramoyl-L-alanine--D-glutamate ligase [Bacilli bacterium]
MYENKNIVILGFGKSGFASAKVLSKNNKVTLVDIKCKDKHDKHQIKKLKNLGVTLILGNEPINILEHIDILVKNPGVPLTHKYVSFCEKKDIPVVNEVEIAYSLINKDVTYITITGSNGKTTTCALLYEILKQGTKKVFLTGNIGYSLINIVDEVKDKDIVIVEVSSHQLTNMFDFKSNISVLLNIYQTHLDFFKDYDHYKYNKARVFNNHTSDELAIINKDNKEAMDVVNKINSNKKYFSMNDESCLSYVKDNFIWYKKEKIINLDKLKIVGKHNYENIMACVIIAKELNISNDIISNTICLFKGVKHRLELISVINGIKFINDSKSTNMTSSKMAVNALDGNIILLLGGLDRNEEYNIDSVVKDCKKVISFGNVTSKIKEECDKINIECISCNSIKEAIIKAFKTADNGDLILLSPGFASWDAFDSYEERGIYFKQIVKELENEFN